MLGFYGSGFRVMGFQDLGFIGCIVGFGIRV